MYRSFIATIAAAAVALTTMGAAPARADDQDLARALAAILGAAVVGKIIHDKKKKKRANYQTQRQVPVYQQPRRRTVQPQVRSQRSYVQPQVQQRQRHVEPQVQQRLRHLQPHIQPRPLPRKVNRRLLPAQCFRSFDTYRGKVRAFGQRCLQNNYRFSNNLPRHCKYRIQTRHGQRIGYEARCLRDAGYRLARG